METSHINLTHDWILSGEDRNFITPPQSKLFKMRVQQIQILEIEVEGFNAHEAQDRALKIIGNAPEMAKILRTDLGHSTIEEI